MIIICFLVAIIFNITYVLLGFYNETLIENRIYCLARFVIVPMNLIALIIISYLSTDGLFGFMNASINFIIIYFTYYLTRIVKRTWYFYIILIILPSIAILAIKGANKYIIDCDFQIAFGILLLAGSVDFFRDKKYSLLHYSSLILGIIAGIYLVFTGVIKIN